MVAVDGGPAMCGIESLGNLRDHAHHPLERPRLSRKLIAQSRAVGKVLHDEVEPAVVLACVVHGKNVRMVETTEELGLLAKSPYPVLVVCHLSKDHLDGNLRRRGVGFALARVE